jgi:hypothetical protein
MSIDPIAVAVEHLLWAADHGQSPGDVLDSIGVNWPNAHVRTDDVLIALAIRWQHLQPAVAAYDKKRQANRGN